MRVKRYIFYPVFALMGFLLVSCATQKEAARSLSSEQGKEVIKTTTTDKRGGGDFSEITATVYPTKLPSPNPPPSVVGSDVVEEQPLPPKIPLPSNSDSLDDSTAPSKVPSKTSTAPQNPIPSRYRVILDADKQINVPGEAGALNVWIGDSTYEQPQEQEDKIRAKTLISNTKAKRWARVSPYGEAFTITPVEPISCFEIDPSGSEVRFNLIPKKSKSGVYKVGATVYLYGLSDCSDTPIPKFSADLKVSVLVNKKEVAKVIAYEKGGELWDVFWKGLMDFWGALVAVVFGTLLFMVRKKLKNWSSTGHEKSE
jgi:hypothetical protein